MQLTPMIIAGNERQASNERHFTRCNPVDGSVVSKAAAATVDDAIESVEAAASFFPDWSTYSPAERRNALLGASQSLKAHGDKIVESMMAECGASEAWARFNIKLGSEMLLEAAAITTQINGHIIPANRTGTTAFAVRQPAGVVFSMAPWNAPVVLGVRSMATPLACGNTVVIKSSEICPHTFYLIVYALIEGGIPSCAINLISNHLEDARLIIETIIAQAAIRRINFTGSTRIGKVIAEIASHHLKPVLLELGSKSPLIVLQDADIDSAIDAALFGGFLNQGQICMSTERLLLHHSIADQFTQILCEKIRSRLNQSHQTIFAQLGSVVDAKAADRIRFLISDAVDKGAKVLIGGGGKGTLLEATVLDRVSPSMTIYNEEIFGPIVNIIRAGSDDEIVRIANDTDYGLTASVFSRDISHALSIAKRIDSGICHINGPTVHDEAHMPFGGVKASGYGRFGGQAGIEEFTELRWITIHEGEIHYPI